MKKKKLKKLGRVFSAFTAVSMVVSGASLTSLAKTVTESYEVGTYEGESTGYGNGKIAVTLQIDEKDGVKYIADISVEQEGQTYWEDYGFEDYLQRIKENNGTDGIDAISHATLTSDGVKNAVDQALKKADPKAAEEPEEVEEPVSDEIDASIFDGGDGSQENPYMIATADQLRSFAKSLNSKIHYAEKYIKLTADVDISGEDWIPVGENQYYFDGVFEGDNHTITGMTFGSESNPADTTVNGQSFALFGELGSEAVIRNLNLDHIYANVEGEHAAVLAGVATYAEGSLIDHVHVRDAKMKSVINAEQNTFVAGLVDVAYQARIANSSADVDLYGASAAWAQVAGLVGQNNRALIANCYATGKISGGGVYPEAIKDQIQPVPVLGGLVGMQAGTLVNAYAKIDISSECKTDYFGATSAWVTFLGETYQTYYATDSKQEITDEETNEVRSIVPAQSVGAIVRPGVTSAGKAYSGAIELDVTGYTKEELASAQMAEKLNDNLTKLNVDIANGARTSYYWEKSEYIANYMSTWKLAADGVVFDDGKQVKAEYDADTSNKITEYVNKYQKKEEEPTNPDTPKNPDTPEVPSEPVTPEITQVKEGTEFTGKDGATYRITDTKAKTVTFVSATKNTKGKITIPATVKYANVKYKVTKIADQAFYNQKKLTEIVVGKNVVSIGNKAFAKTAKLKKITVKTSLLKGKNISKKAFLGIKTSTKIKVPKKKVKSYKKLFRKKGLNKKVKVK